MQFVDSDIPPVALLALAVVAVALLLGSTRRRLRRSRAPTGASMREQYKSLSDQTGVARDIETVMVELDQLSRQVHGRLDAKIAKLERLLREADERIDGLSRQRRAAAGHPTLDVTLEPETPHAAGLETKADRRRDAYGDIYRLADAGLSPVEIARQLGQSTGAIELILSLRTAKARASEPVLGASS